VFLHGFFDHGLSFAPLIARLGVPLYCVCLDHRGFGDSDWIGAGGYYYFPDYWQDVLCLVDHLGLDRFGLVGHSMGGGIATGVAALVPSRVTAMVLLEGMGPPYHDPTDVIGRLDRWIDGVRREDMAKDVAGRRASRAVMPSVEDAVAKLIRSNPKLSREIATELAGTFTEAVPGGVVWKVDPLHRTQSPKPFLKEEIEPMWRALTMPVMSVYGVDSPWIPEDLPYRHSCLPNVRAVMIEGAGHNLHHDQPDRIADLVTEWMTT
jgi:pimeloyl-ACP methyl ester carboxylesterase